MIDLKDRAFIITGSTTGIGEAVARRVVRHGGRVLIHGRERDRGEAIVRELGAERAALQIDDLSDPDAPARVVEAATKAFGRIDGVCNNAAWVVRSNLDTTDLNLFDKTIAINVRAPMLLIKAALPMLKQSKGAIVNIGSINGYCGEPNQLAYSMSKAALQTMSRNLGDALGRTGVRVNHLVVGWVASENEKKLKIKEGLPTDWYENPPLEYVPTGKMTEPDDVARVAIFWLSDASRPFTGGIIELEQYPMIGRNPLKEE